MNIHDFIGYSYNFRDLTEQRKFPIAMHIGVVNEEVPRHGIWSTRSVGPIDGFNARSRQSPALHAKSSPNPPRVLE